MLIPRCRGSRSNSQYTKSSVTSLSTTAAFLPSTRASFDGRFLKPSGTQTEGIQRHGQQASSSASGTRNSSSVLGGFIATSRHDGEAAERLRPTLRRRLPHPSSFYTLHRA